MADSFQDVIVSEIAVSQKNALVGGPFGSKLGGKDYVTSGIPVRFPPKSKYLFH